MSVENNDLDVPTDILGPDPGEHDSPISDAFYPNETLKDRVVCIPRNGQRVLVWWSLTAEGLNRARRGLEEPDQAKLVLRVHRESEAGKKGFDDFALERWIGHRWLTAFKAGTRLSISVGYSHPNGFVQIAGAAPSSMPSSQVRNEPIRNSTTRYVDGRLSVEATENGLPWSTVKLNSEPTPVSMAPEAQLLGWTDPVSGEKL